MNRPIRNDVEHAIAVAEATLLLGATPNTTEHDRLELLSILIDAYERQHHKICKPELPDPTLLEALRAAAGHSLRSNASVHELSVVIEILRELTVHVKNRIGAADVFSKREALKRKLQTAAHNLSDAHFYACEIARAGRSEGR